MADKKQNYYVIKGGYYEYPTVPAKRKINFTKWGTPMPSYRDSNDKTAAAKDTK